MPTLEKEQIVEAIKDRFANCDAVIMADYRGLSVKEMQQLRNKLREAGAELTVYKNSLTEIAMRELAMPSMSEYLAGPTGFVFIDGDPVAPAKALTDVRQGARRHSSSRAGSSRTRSSTPPVSRRSPCCRRAKNSSPSFSAPCSTRSSDSPVSSTDRWKRSRAPSLRSPSRRPPRSAASSRH